MTKKVVFSGLFTEFNQDVTVAMYQLGILTEGLESSADLYGIQLPDIKTRDGKHILKSVQLRYTRKHKAVTMMRTLVSKVSYFPDSVERIDILLMYEQILKLEELSRLNPNFNEKFGRTLEVLAKVLKEFRLKPKTTNLDIRKLADRLKQDVPDFLYPRRNMPRNLELIRHMFYYSVYRETGTPVKELPPKAYIGKGYTDKGTASDPAFDGSPSWQTIASHNLEDDDEEH